MKKYARPEPRAVQAFEMSARKALGQHFLKDKSVVDGMVGQANMWGGVEKRCVEIGPGQGVLTLALLENGWDVAAIEKDDRSVEGLKKSLVPQFQEKIQVVQSDVLKFNPVTIPEVTPKRLCIGNLPYYITSDIMLWFCANSTHYCAGIFMIQDEVADRITAEPGTKAYGRLTVRLQLFFNVSKLFTVLPSSFIPPPKINSAVIELVPTGFAFGSPEEDRFFSQFTAALFSARRKMLRKTVAPFFSAREAAEREKTEQGFWALASTFGVTEQTRPDVVSPAALLALHKYLWKEKL
jgi:16S rRNA (adenine1518-N6/adenine1519-N6)-dimethyltransferase